MSKQSLGWLVLRATRTGKTNLCHEGFCLCWMKEKASWTAHWHVGPDFSEDVEQDGAFILVGVKMSEFVPRLLVNALTHAERGHGNKPPLDIATCFGIKNWERNDALISFPPPPLLCNHFMETRLPCAFI